MLERELLDAAEPPRIVFEHPERCKEGDRAEELLRRTLTPALAPSRGWTVTLRIERNGRTPSAEGEITDATGAPVAHRTVPGAGGECGGLARAVGVWASLVLDAELRRANAAAMEAQADSAAGTRSGSGTGTVNASENGAGAEPATAWPAPAPPEKPSPEHDWYLHHDDQRTLELGAGVFLMTGTGGGALAGPTAFVVVEAGHGLFLRPSLAAGQSLTSLPPTDLKNSTWAATRFDACLRLPGLYSRNHGMQLDICGGTDLGFTIIDTGTSTTLPYLDVGPSIDLRGELASRLSAVLRLVAGVNLIRQPFLDLSGAPDQPPIGVGRLELAVSWDLR
jgi:hypothetical protein